MLCKNFSRQQFEMVFQFFQENRVWNFLQIVSQEGNLNEFQIPFSDKKKKKWSVLSSAE